MTNIGAEVGQKMRSAIKAKLLELNCYVDDELPDYVMVMVANKRTKSQMKEDLQLFLTTKTATFVDWLHIVLKKLKEVTVTNPEVYKKNSKRKIVEVPDANVKKEKKDRKLEKKDKQDKAEGSPSSPTFTSLTDNLPINANKLAEQRKIIIMKENQSNNSEVLQDTFDIPLLSEVNMSTEEELEDIERKIRSVKSRLGLLVESDDETGGGDSVSLKAEPEDALADDRDKNTEQPSETENRTPPRRIEHTRITFSDKDEPETRSLSPPPPSKPKSILERLGKRKEVSAEEEPKPKKNRISLSEFRKEEEKLSHNRDKVREERKSRKSRQSEPAKVKENILSRLGVQSKVSVPSKEDPPKNREVPSVIKIKPRVIPADAPQANKNLLLKAVAEAQRSIAQTPVVGNALKSDALFTKRFKEKRGESHNQQQQKKKGSHRLSDAEKNKIKKILSTQDDKEENMEYIPTPLRKSQDLAGLPKYIPSSTKIHHQQHESNDDDTEDSSTSPPPPSPAPEPNPIRQQFIVTLDGLAKTKFSTTAAASTTTTKIVEQQIQPETKEDSAKEKPSIKSRLDRKRSPSPIIFDMSSSPVKTKSNIPDKLPIVHTPSSVKNKERCKYWPACRQGEKCEFVHPTSNCDKFPHCKFGDKCLYVHPVCKFASSCTRRDCPYSHGNKSASRLASTTAAKLSTQICKFFPSCSNLNCQFLHPKPCKFGKFCKNQRDCTFSHPFVPKKSSLTWRSQ